MRAMLLAAGYGERMRPLTEAVPKPALSVLGRPIVVQLLERLARFGVGRAVINTHHLPEVLRRTIERYGSPSFPAVEYSHEEDILGTGGGLARAAPRLRGDGPFAVINTDCLSDVDLGAALDAHRRSGAEATLVLAPARKSHGVVEVDETGRVLSLSGAPSVAPQRVAERRLFTGVHLLNESVLDRLPADSFHNIRELYREMAAEGALGSFEHDGYWHEFGTPESYLAGSLALMEIPIEGRREIAVTDPVESMDGGLLARGPGATIDSGTTLRGRVAVGFASRISRGCAVRDSIVSPESWVGPDCRLERVIVAPKTELPAGFTASDAVVARDVGSATRAPEVRRQGGLLLRDLAGAGARG